MKLANAMLLNIQPESPPLRLDKHGVCRVAGTRVTLETVVCAFQRGCSAEEIHLQYPSVPLPDVYATIAYYLKHGDEVETYLKKTEHDAQEIMRKIRSRQPLTQLRERLLAGQKSLSQ